MKIIPGVSTAEIHAFWKLFQQCWVKLWQNSFVHLVFSKGKMRRKLFVSNGKLKVRKGKRGSPLLPWLNIPTVNIFLCEISLSTFGFRCQNVEIVGKYCSILISVARYMQSTKHSSISSTDSSQNVWCLIAYVNPHCILEIWRNFFTSHTH